MPNLPENVVVTRDERGRPIHVWEPPPEMAKRGWRKRRLPGNPRDAAYIAEKLNKDAHRPHVSRRKPDLPAYFRTRKNRNGRPLYYWEPGPGLRKFGWQTKSLGSSKRIAIKRANELNARVEDWRQQGQIDLHPPKKRPGRYLVTKPGRDGPRYYWQPSAALVGHGFRPRRLSADYPTAVAEAEAMSQRVDEWRQALTDGDRVFAMRTLGAVTEHYKRSRHFNDLAANTQADYSLKMKQLCAWRGALPICVITGRDVFELYEKTASEMPHKAHGLVRILGIVFTHAIRLGWARNNPTKGLSLPQPPPRDAAWSESAFDHFIETADAMDLHSVGTAAMLGGMTAQRRGDIVALRWEDIRDGAIEIAQGKTGRKVRVPLVPELADRLDAMPKDTRTVLINERTGRPYTPDGLTRSFAEVRKKAAGRHPEIADLRLHDLRRSLVIWLGEEGATEGQIAAITGHKIERSRQILETYLPRTSAMSAAGMELIARRRSRRHSRAADGEQVVTSPFNSIRSQTILENTTSGTFVQRAANDS